MKIFIDAGHGGKDSGATSGGLIEKDMTLMCSKGVQLFLQKNGCEVKLARNNDKYLSLTERANMANLWGADLFISLHFNAGGGDRGEVIHSVSGGKGKLLAEKIADEIKKLGDYINDSATLSALGEIKYKNKVRLAQYVSKKNGISS